MMEHVEVKAPWYREGTLTSPKKVNFVLNHGGIGDYICWLTAIEWTAKYHPYIEVTVFSPLFFLDIPKHVFSPYPNVKVKNKKGLTDEIVNANPTYIPTNKATLNCTGANLVDLGFAYFANKQFAPSYFKNYCQLDMPKLLKTDIISHERYGAFHSMVKNYDYAVLTPYYSNENRKMHPKVFNQIREYLISKKIVPVLVGLEAWAERRQQMSKEYNFDKCINLLNKTSLLEAAVIVNTAEMVIGVDNGLLHLAGMTDVPIIFGYTVIGPEYREPRRDKGITLNILPPEELKCRFCLPQMRFHFNHDFNNCIYKDNACVELLADFKPWKRAIDIIIEETK